MKNYQQCFYQYRKAACELEEFKASEEHYNMKGYLRDRLKKKTYGGKESFYKEVYYIRVDYVNGKAKRTEKYVKKDEVDEYRHKQTEKKANRKKYNELKKREGRLFLQLKKHFKGNTEVWDEIEKNRTKKENFREKGKRVVSALGEGMRSKSECIVASLAYAFKIAYLYEFAVRLYKGIVHPDFIFFVKDKRVLFELLGMYEDKEYRDAWAKKEISYRKNGYVMGKNLVCVACKDSEKINLQKLAQILLDIKEGKIPGEMLFV